MPTFLMLLNGLKTSNLAGSSSGGTADAPA